MGHDEQLADRVRSIAGRPTIGGGDGKTQRCEASIPVGAAVTAGAAATSDGAAAAVLPLDTLTVASFTRRPWCARSWPSATATAWRPPLQPLMTTQLG